MAELSALKERFEVAQKLFPNRVIGTFEEFVEQALNRYIPDIEPEPVLVGHLNKFFGWEGYHHIKPGDPVYEHRGLYFFYKYSIKTGNAEVVKFYKETLRPCIKFIDNV